MNSSGIKRGLATTAVSALAIAGLPLFASAPASAANGDVLTTAYAGPALDGDAGGALIVLKSKNILETEVDSAGELKVIAQSLTGTANTANQTIGAVEFVDFIPDAADNEFGGLDTFDEIVVRVPVDTRNLGDTANFAIFLDDDQAPAADAGTVQSSEPTTNVSVTTAGPVAQIQISPNSQTVPATVQSAPYTITLKDAGGRTTQLADGTSATIEGDGATIAPANNGDADTEAISSDQLARGTFNFRATGPTVDVYDLQVQYGAVTGRATLDVVESAAIDADELNIVTGADTWFSPTDNPGFGAITDVAPQQSSFVFNFQSDNVAVDRNDFVTVTFTGNGVTFGGATSITKPIRLDNNGAGTFTVDVDPASIQTGDTIAVSGTVNLTLRYTAAVVRAIVPGQAAYVAAPRSSTTVTARLVDQYRNPISSGQLNARITAGPNTGDQAARVNVGADGVASFTFTDDSAVPGNTDVVTFEYFENSFDPSGDALVGGNTTQIRYTADGQGSDFTTRLNNTTASGAGYDPASVRVVPLTDGVADEATGAEYVDLDVVNAEANSPITITVDNGALILEPGETNLSQASASVTNTAGTGTITGRTPLTAPAGYAIVGTKTGLVTVTVTSAGRTETSQFTVAQNNTVVNTASTARNIDVTGPTAGVSGDVVTFTAKITDAFGNPVAGFARNGFGQSLNVTVSGPGFLQDGSAQSDANGNIALNVRLADGADSPVTVTVTASGAQFGAAANQTTAAAAANSGPGLPASVSSDSATLEDITDIEALEEAVEAAQARVDAAEAALNAAQADVDVAQADLDTLRAKLAAQKAAKAKAKKDGDRRKVRVIKKRIKATKAAIEAAQVELDAAKADVVAAQAELEAAEAELAEAEANLEEAQN